MVFCFVQNFFSDNTRDRIFIFFCRAKREFFFQNLTLGYMTKTLNQIFFFFLHQNQNIFFSNIGNQNIFLEKKHTPPPLQVKWSFPQVLCIDTFKQTKKGITVFWKDYNRVYSRCVIIIVFYIKKAFYIALQINPIRPNSTLNDLIF